VARRPVGVAFRVVHHQADHIAGVVHGGHPGEGDPVDVVEVATAGGVDLLGGAGLAGHLISRHRTGGTSALLVAHRVALHDRAQHLAHGLGGLCGHHAHTSGPRLL